MRQSVIMAAVALLLLTSSCGVNRARYASFIEHMPKSILVLPPLNSTPDIRASDTFLSTVTQPLAECGYYVFPIAVVDRMFKENGVPTPGEMHQVPLHKLAEVFGADAALYIVIEEWGTQYLVFGSNTEVSASYRLVDVGSGATLWQWKQRMVEKSGTGGAGIAGAVVAAAVHAAVSVATEQERDVAIKANQQAFILGGYRLLKGWRHPEHEEDQKRYGPSS